MDNEDTENVNSVLSRRLPYLVVEVLLKQLDIFSLKTLRLVSKTTKSWIEQPEFLRMFPVVINGETRMSEVLACSLTNGEYPVPWNHFIFSKKYKCVSDSDIKKFLSLYSDTIRVLEFNWPQEKIHHELRILSSCPNLESIKSNQLCFETLIPAVLRKNLLSNWKNMKHFHVHRFRGGRDSPLTEMEFFERILTSCTELETLTVPQFSYDYQPMKGFDYGEAFMNLVICPLINYIKTRRLKCITVPYYGLTDEIFLKLADTCRESGTVLLNVRSAFLKNLPVDYLDMLDIIGSLEGITDTIIRAPLPNVQSICFVNPSFQIDNNSYQMPLFPKLRHVEIDFKFSRKSQKSMELFVHRLGKVSRPSVYSLKITYQPGPPVVFPINISPLDLVTSFVNLRVLHIKDWEGEDDQFLRLWALAGNVIELSLANCRNLTDRGILGDNPLDAKILKLKYIRILSIINYLYVDQGEVNITEMSFIHAFRHMRLKSFHFFDGNLLVSGRSIPLTAIEGLWNGVFGSTIEDFVLQETDLENCDMILKKKMENSAKRDKRKYSDNVFRSPMLGFRMGISSNAGSGFGSNVSSQNPHNNPSETETSFISKKCPPISSILHQNNPSCTIM